MSFHFDSQGMFNSLYFIDIIFMNINMSKWKICVILVIGNQPVDLEHKHLCPNWWKLQRV